MDRVATGSAKRFGAAYADTVVSRMGDSRHLANDLSAGPARYFYRGSGSVRSRILDALAAVICRGDDWRMELNYSQVFGNFAGAGISNLYRAPGDRSVGLTLRNGLIITGSGEVDTLLRESLSRKLTPNVPTFANGKP